MITMRIEETTDVTVCGKKVWISGQDNMQFGNFWEECNKSGFTAKLKEAANADSCTKSKIMGVSRVEEGRITEHSIFTWQQKQRKRRAVSHLL